MLPLSILVLLIMLSGFLIYAVYDEFIMARLKGRTHLTVSLKRKEKFDGIIFVGLMSILLYQYLMSGDKTIIGLLLIGIIIISSYCFFIRTPKLLLKQEGLFVNNVYIPYNRIKQLKISTQKEALSVELEKKSLYVWLKNKDDADKIIAITKQSAR